MDDTAQFRLAWIGSQGGGCERLIERLQLTCDQLSLTLAIDRHAQLNAHTIDALRVADRIVLACETRSEYPWSGIELLEQTDIAVPWGVVTSAWQAGSRRSGIGVVSHWQQPWYRWWESWLGWFLPELARAESLLPNQFAAVTTTQDFSQPNCANPNSSFVDNLQDEEAELASDSASAHCIPISRGRPIVHQLTDSNSTGKLLIVCDCPQSATTWQLMAAQVDWPCAAVTYRQLIGSDDAPKADLILWDDSSVACLPSTAIEAALQSQAACLRGKYPHAKIAAGLQLTHLDTWSVLSELGVNELFIKPSYGLPLADYLFYVRRRL